MKLATSMCGVIASLTIVCMAVGQDANESKKELANLQGVWRVVSSQIGGEKAPADEVKRRKVTIKGNVMVYEYGNEQKESRQGTIKVGPKTKAFDWTPTLPEPVPTMLAIYELKGDELKIGFPNDGPQVRPTRFVVGKNDVVWLLVLKRVAPDLVSNEMNKLEGKWIAVAMQSGGKRVEGEALTKTDLGETLVIRDGSIRTINKEGKELKSRITIDPTRTPKSLDRVFMVDGKELVVRSVYTLDDDILRLCTGMENEHVRPKSFTQDGTYVMTYKRQAALKGQPEQVKKEGVVFRAPGSFTLDVALTPDGKTLSRSAPHHPSSPRK
jgi:uncharacterized protein (TIGR03067 family)